ncbi:putative 2OG-Fe(II) oxygenase [Sphingomonas sp. LY54]|uniref:putative 2OG-Fe(II) oxygenase n=1 Tax=Sphingomonas sp. LY54 TaxID=3095343 RepID=UPI002D79B9FA|nr:putative 2OG-Fe(II) oxygenase [Sphingomonas sp. LY54]WRP29271.1 putative 2OG-Fe(II) oxygenase [Sphingomonas sp. LY54]
MIRWRPPVGDNVAAPAVARSLLERAIAASPANPILRMKRADLNLDRFDFAAAASDLEAALHADPVLPGLRSRLARCRNALGQHHEALAVGAEPGDAHALYQHGLALDALGREQEAERAYRAVLDQDPHHRHACRKLCRLLRRADRSAEMLAVCEDLAARGAAHAQLFYDWGIASALTGDIGRARALLFDRARVAEIALPVPDGFADIAAFHAALAEEILGNPHRLSEFDPGEEANRGSSRVEALFAGRRPDMMRALLQSLQRLVDDYTPSPAGPFDPWRAARPNAARLRAWGLIQRRSEHEEWHIHRGGWLSGVYYVRVPRGISAKGEGRGCIEFGPPRPVARSQPNLISPWRYAPREGMLLLAPSHYSHRTIPSGIDEHRISFAFDVVPDEQP